MSKSLEQRIDRLESIDEIRQLAGKYSLSLDMRDLYLHRIFAWVAVKAVASI